jgi:hypothetical protein
MNWLKRKIVKWLLPSGIIVRLRGRKRLIGGISLILWALIYALPEFCLAEACTQATDISRQVQDLLLSYDLKLDEVLLKGGSGLTVVGLIDRVLKYKPSDTAQKVAKKVKL